MADSNSFNRIAKLAEQYFPILGIAVFVTILLIGNSLLVWPQFVEMRESAFKQYDNGLDTVVQRRAQIEELEQIAEEYAKVDQRTYQVIDRIIPPAQESSRLFEEMEQFFNESDLTLRSISIAEGASFTSAEEDTEITPQVDSSFDESALLGEVDTPVIEPVDTNIGVVQLTLSIEAPSGSYEDFKRMLSEVEGYTRIFDLLSVSFNAGNNSYTLVVNTYQQIP